MIKENFLQLSIKAHVVGTYSSCLGEAILMSTHNIRFYGESNLKIIPKLSSNMVLTLSVSLKN